MFFNRSDRTVFAFLTVIFLILLPLGTGFGLALYLRRLHRDLEEAAKLAQWIAENNRSEEHPVKEYHVVGTEEPAVEEPVAGGRATIGGITEEPVVEAPVSFDSEKSESLPESQLSGTVEPVAATGQPVGGDEYDPNEILDRMLKPEDIESVPNQIGVDHQTEEAGPSLESEPEEDMLERIMENLEPPGAPDGGEESGDLHLSEEKLSEASTLGSELLGPDFNFDSLAKVQPDAVAEQVPLEPGSPPEPEGSIGEQLDDETPSDRDRAANQIISASPVPVAPELLDRVQEIREIGLGYSAEMVQSACAVADAPQSCGSTTCSQPMLRLRRKK